MQQSPCNRAYRPTMFPMRWRKGHLAWAEMGGRPRGDLRLSLDAWVRKKGAPIALALMTPEHPVSPARGAEPSVPSLGGLSSRRSRQAKSKRRDRIGENNETWDCCLLRSCGHFPHGCPEWTSRCGDFI